MLKHASAVLTARPDHAFTLLHEQRPEKYRLTGVFCFYRSPGRYARKDPKKRRTGRSCPQRSFYICISESLLAVTLSDLVSTDKFLRPCPYDRPLLRDQSVQLCTFLRSPVDNGPDVHVIPFFIITQLDTPPYILCSSFSFPNDNYNTMRY
jgi:hypothetical protein